MKTQFFVSILFLVTLLNGCLSEYDRADFILPQNVTKDFVILLGEACGEDVPIVNGRKQYQIRRNGFLIVQNEFKNLPIDYNFYRVNDDGVKEKIDINYYRESDGRPYPGVRILGHSQIKGKLEKTADCLSFIILYSETDNQYEFFGKKEKFYEEEIMNCRKFTK